MTPRKPRKPKHGGKRPGVGRPPSSDLTARLVVRVAPDVLAEAKKAVCGGPALAEAVRWYVGELAALRAPVKRKSATTRDGVVFIASGQRWVLG